MDIVFNYRNGREQHMKIASSDVYSNSNYSYQKDLSIGGAGTGGFFAGIVEKTCRKGKN